MTVRFSKRGSTIKLLVRIFHSVQRHMVRLGSAVYHGSHSAEDLVSVSLIAPLPNYGFYGYIFVIFRRRLKKLLYEMLEEGNIMGVPLSNSTTVDKSVLFIRCKV